MLGYICLALALFGGMLKGFCGKELSKTVKGMESNALVTALRMIFCTALGFGVLLFKDGVSSLAVGGRGFAVCILSAVSMTVFCVCWMFAYKTSAYMFLSVFTMLSSVITCILGSIVFHEPIPWNKWVGMAILFVSLFIMKGYNTRMAGRLRLSDLGILVFGMLGCAVADFSQKLFVKTVSTHAPAFNFYTYSLSFVLIFILWLLLSAKSGRTFSERTSVCTGRTVALCFAIAVGLYVNSLSKTTAAIYLTGAQIYPVLQGANLIGSAILARILLKEKLDWKGCIGLVLAFAGIVIMNVL